MNIFDLAWSIFYLHDKQHDIGFPLLGASTSMTVFIILYIECLFFLFNDIGIFELPDYPFALHATIFCVFIALFMIRHWNKWIREKRLNIYQEYKDKYPRKTKIRFLFFIITPVVFLIVDFTIMDIQYNQLHR